ncbi:MAG TPA: hypothetical protein DF712_05205 [Balneola sp.]|jgi:hypothetical protein|nr:hypothetical protein [Bacteroidota bacterium]HCI72289.1 hypothetical protein [Balneola sp.]HCT51839.1 hypothetical protein [Balneola sp.]|tara:strand:- start:15134 stop:15319 length:186 start_codon:yes stop_codon:yes gene_type:complete
MESLKLTVLIGTVVIVTLVFLHKKNYQSWEDQDWFMKTILINIAVGAIAFLLMTLILFVFP